MEGVGVSYEAIVIVWARESEGFAWSGTHGPVRGGISVVGSDWRWVRSGLHQDHSQLREEWCQSQSSGHGEKFGLNLC